MGSAARKQAAALTTWHDELHLNAVASAASGAALELPFIEPAPTMCIPFAGSVQPVEGMAYGFLCLDRRHVLGACAALRRLWAAQLTPELLQGYNPIILSEETVLRIAANAVASNGSVLGKGRALRMVKAGSLAVTVVQMNGDTIDSTRTAADAYVAGDDRAAQREVLCDCLHLSAASHM